MGSGESPAARKARRASAKEKGKGFSSASEFEKSLTGYDDERLAEYEGAYSAVTDYNSGLRKNMQQAINENGYTDYTDMVIDDEIAATQRALSELPKYKTPAQLGAEEGLNERLEVLNDLKAQKGAKAKAPSPVEIVKETNAPKAQATKKITNKQVDAMSRSKLVSTARELLLKSPTYSGLSRTEALRRIDALMPANTDAQLRKLIKRYK